MATIRPLNDRVIIKRTSAVETITPGGIVIPEQARERPQEGIVIAVGPGNRSKDASAQPIVFYDPKADPKPSSEYIAAARLALDLKVGERVLFGKFAGTEIKLDGEDYLIMREDDILGVIEA